MVVLGVAVLGVPAMSHADGRPPKVVVIGEFQWGSAFVPNMAPPDRLDVAMHRTSLQSMRYRCAHLGGHNLRLQHGFYVCHGADY